MGANGTPANASAPAAASTTTHVDLKAQFPAEGLALLSAEETGILQAKLDLLTGDPKALAERVAAIKKWMYERLADLAELQAKKEKIARFKFEKAQMKFEEKVGKQFDRVLMTKKEKEQEREDMRRRSFFKPKVLVSFVAEADTAKNVLVLKNNGEQRNVSVMAKTIITIQEADGDLRVGTLGEFKSGDRVFGLVRRDPQDPQQLVGLVLVKLYGSEIAGAVPGPGY